MVTQQLWPFAPQKTEEVAHFVIVGFGAMGQALAVQLAQLGNFPNRQRNRFTSWTDGEDAQLGIREFLPEADAWSWNKHPLPTALRVDSPRAIQYVCNAEFVELASPDHPQYLRRVDR